MRKNKQGGFTLIEMLIVVAIIAILVAVSIPIVNNSLERAREATDAANERAAKAEAVIMYLNGTPASDTFYKYDAADGKLYTKGAHSGDYASYGKCSKHKNKIIFVKLGTDGNVQIAWGKSTETSFPSGTDAHNGTVADNPAS